MLVQQVYFSWRNILHKLRINFALTTTTTTAILSFNDKNWSVKNDINSKSFFICIFLVLQLGWVLSAWQFIEFFQFMKKSLEKQFAQKQNTKKNSLLQHKINSYFEIFFLALSLSLSRSKFLLFLITVVEYANALRATNMKEMGGFLSCNLSWV